MGRPTTNYAVEAEIRTSTHQLCQFDAVTKKSNTNHSTTTAATQRTAAAPAEHDFETDATPAAAVLEFVYRNDPYAVEDDCKVFLFAQEPEQVIPEGTLHAHALVDVEVTHQRGSNKTELLTVGFMPYPEEEFTLPAADLDKAHSLPKAEMARLFLGQLPYAVTDMQLQWLCHTFGGPGCAVVFPERIVKKDPAMGNAKVPTGCVHAYVHPEHAEQLMSALHKRLLIDDTGVWFARNEAELAVLSAHTNLMKKDRACRPFNRPYDTIVAQQATSTFVVRPPTYNKTTSGAAGSQLLAAPVAAAAPPKYGRF